MQTTLLRFSTFLGFGKDNIFWRDYPITEDVVVDSLEAES
jgi:hypothetical protein